MPDPISFGILAGVLIAILLLIGRDVRRSTAVAERDAARNRAANADEHATEMEASLGEALSSNERLRLELQTLKATKPTLTAEQIAQAKEAKCTHCGGVHSISCPRVKRIRFRPDESPLEVEYWDTYPTDRILFLEDYLEPDSAPSADHPALPEQTEAR